jgi:peptidyl-prolyl cis-trans isomerase D
MLQSVRKYTQGWVATVIGIILSLAFILWGIENYLRGGSKKDILAKVNGKQITSQEVESDFQRMITRFREQLGADFILPPLMQKQLKQQALNNLIMQNVLIQTAFDSGFRVTRQETSAMIKQMPVFLDNGRFSREKFNFILNKMGYTQQEFFVDVSQTLVLNQVASGIAGSAFVLPNELNQAIALIEQKRDINYVVISKSAFLKNNPVSANEIQRYYEEHPSQFKVPAKIQIEYVQLLAEDIKKNMTVSKQDIENYFELNSDLDKGNPKHLLKAKEALQQQKAEQAFLSASDKLLDLAYTNPHSLTKAANTLGLSVKTSEYFTKEGGGSANSFTKNPKIIAAAFNTDMVKNRVNSNLIELTSGNVIVMRVKDYQPEGLASLKEVQAKIKTILREKQAALLAKQKVELMLTQIKNKNDFKNVVAKENLTLITKQKISRHEKNINPEILKLAFAISPLSMKPVLSTRLSNGDYGIVLLVKSDDMPVNKATNEIRSVLNKSYSDTYGRLEYDLYAENQLKKARIKLLGRP